MAFNKAPGFADVFRGSAFASGYPGSSPTVIPTAATSASAKTPQQLQYEEQQRQSDAMFEKIRQLTEGRANEIRNDPVQAQVMEYLKGVLGGQNVPYTDTVLNSLQAQQGKGSASAEAAQMQSLRDALGANGGSIYDPSYQAASNEAASQRQGRNLDYSGQLNAQAGVENFNAKANAGNSLGQLRSNQNAQISGLTQALAGYQSQRFQDTPTSTPQTLMPQYGGGGSMGAAGSTATKSGTTAGFEPPQASNNMTQQVMSGTMPRMASTAPAMQTNQAGPSGAWAGTAPAATLPNPGAEQSPWVQPKPAYNLNDLLGGLQSYFR